MKLLAMIGIGFSLFTTEASAHGNPKIQSFCETMLNGIYVNLETLEAAKQMPRSQRQKVQELLRLLTSTNELGWDLWDQLGCEYTGPEGDEGK